MITNGMAKVPPGSSENILEGGHDQFHQDLIKVLRGDLLLYRAQ